jgi:hypothetical protein
MVICGWVGIIVSLRNSSAAKNMVSAACMAALTSIFLRSRFVFWRGPTGYLLIAPALQQSSSYPAALSCVQVWGREEGEAQRVGISLPGGLKPEGYVLLSTAAFPWAA